MNAREYREAHQQELHDLLITLCGIPAPSNKEELRAAFCRDWFMEHGAACCDYVEVSVDEALNVRCMIRGTGEGTLPVAVFMAHTDTVFPDMEPMPIVEVDGKICCPGVGDDTANLVVLMMTAAYILENNLRPKDYDMLIVANSGEEGLGNLKGSRQIVKEFGDRIACFYSFDGGCGGYMDKAVGSHRYRVEARTVGGHSYGSFGNPNAIAVLAGMIGSFYELKVPNKGYTTYNVGTISGGTSVNTIAQQAEMLYEYRSDDREDLAFMEKHFWSVIESYRAKGHDIRVELVGDRPCGGEVDPAKQQELADLAVKVLSEAYPEIWAERMASGKIKGFSGSTDCNIPLSMGIPSICFGCYVGGGAHTREEWVMADSLMPGWQAAMNVMLHYFN